MNDPLKLLLQYVEKRFEIVPESKKPLRHSYWIASYIRDEFNLRLSALQDEYKDVVEKINSKMNEKKQRNEDSSFVHSHTEKNVIQAEINFMKNQKKVCKDTVHYL